MPVSCAVWIVPHTGNCLAWFLVFPLALTLSMKRKRKRKKRWFDCNTEKRQNRGTSGVGACNPGLPTMAAETAAPENPLVAGEADTWLGLPWPWQCLQHKKLGCSGSCTWDTGPPAAEVPLAPAPWSTTCEPDTTTWQTHPPIPSLLPLSAPQWWWSLWFRGSWTKQRSLPSWYTRQPHQQHWPQRNRCAKEGIGPHLWQKW